MDWSKGEYFRMPPEEEVIYESANQAGPAQSKQLRTVEEDKIPVVHIKKICNGKQSGLLLAQAKANVFVKLLLLKDFGALSG